MSKIGSSAFDGCGTLSLIILPKTLTKIGVNAFAGCYKLEEVVDLSRLNIHKGESSHGSVAYYAKRVYYADEIVDDYAFRTGWVPELVRYVGTDETITLPENYKGEKYNIGAEAFYDCSSLTSVVIPNSVQEIGDEAFHGCELLSLTIGTGVRSIGTHANRGGSLVSRKIFWLPSTPPSGYTNLSGFHYVPNDQYRCGRVYPYLNSMFEVSNMKYVPVSPAERTCELLDCVYESIDSVVEIGETVSYKGIPMTVENVGAYAFYGHKNIKEVYVSTSLLDYAFAGCSSLAKVSMGDNVKTIGEYAFDGCSSLSTIVIPQATETIGSRAFSRCTSLTNVVIEDRTTNLKFNSGYSPSGANYGSYAFEECLLDSVYIGGKIIFDYSPFSENKSLRSVTIAENVDSIYAKEFYECSNLENVTMGDAVVSIGNQAFHGCNSLECFTFPSALKTIGDQSFTGCKSLSDIKLKTNVKTIGDGAFAGCWSLSTIDIPQTIDIIEYGAFSDCASLTNVVIEDRTTNLELGGDVFKWCPLDSVYIGGNIVYGNLISSSSAFSEKKSLRCVTFANNVDSIYAKEFYECSNLKSVTLGDAIVSIGDQAFSRCSSLESFTFPSAMKAIGDQAFSGCTSMTSLISLATTPPTCGNMALDDIDKWSCVLKVPESSISAYQAADGWKEFFFIESLPTAITEVTEDENLRNATDVYTIGGMKVTSSGKLAKGIYVVDGKKVIVD